MKLNYDKEFIERVNEIDNELQNDHDISSLLLSSFNVMPLAANVTLDSFNNYNGIRTTFSQVSQSVANNSSVIRATVVQYSTAWSSWAAGTVVTITVDGTSRSITVPYFNWSGANSRTLGTLDFTVYHGSNGSKSASISQSWAHKEWPQSKSGTFNPDTIPRASSIGTISGNQIGSEITVNISRKSTSFTHQVWYRLPSQGWVNVGTGFTTSAKFTIPMDSCKFLTNSTSGTLEISIQTKSGSTNIGNEVKKNHTVYVPSSVVPSLSGVTVSEYIADVTNKVGAYVRTKSRLNLGITGASGIHSSTIRSYEITVPGTRITSESGVSNIINSSGSVEIIGKVTDSRGRSATRKMTINVLNYNEPKIENITYKRSNSDGTENPLGDFALIEFKATISSLVNGTEKNKLSYVIKSKRHNETTYTTKESKSVTQVVYNASILLPGYLVDYTYNFIVETLDIFSKITTIGFVPIGELLMHWYRDTLAIGMMLPGAAYNAYIGYKGLKTFGPMKDKDDVEFIALGGTVVEY